jgi:hypothetical protein
LLTTMMIEFQLFNHMLLILHKFTNLKKNIKTGVCHTICLGMIRALVKHDEIAAFQGLCWYIYYACFTTSGLKHGKMPTQPHILLFNGIPESINVDRVQRLMDRGTIDFEVLYVLVS